MQVTNKVTKSIKFSVLSAILCFFAAGFSASAASQSFVENPDRTIPIVVNFLNGNFEQPDLKNHIPPLSYNYTVGTSPSIEDFLASDSVWIFIPDSEVDGWNAKPMDPNDEHEPFANMIEYMRPGYSGYPDRDDQFIDMCGAMNQEFYQTVETTPGTNIYYSYDGTLEGMELRFICGAEITPEYYEDHTMTDSWVTYSGMHTAISSSTYFGFQCLNGTDGRGNLEYNGQFYHNIKIGGFGVYLGNIKFQTQSKILIDNSVKTISSNGALFGEIITYQIEITNHGQTNTSRTVLTDILGDDVAFAGNVQINGQAAEDLFTFDQNSDTLTVYLGDGSSAAAGGSLKGSVSNGQDVGETVTVTFDVKVTGPVGDIIKNQAAVSYDDKDFEKYTQGGYTDYSNITETRIINERCYPFQLTKQLDQKAKQDETFVFQIDQYSFDGNIFLQTFYASVTVPSDSDTYTIQLQNLYAGYYTITELDSNWKYQLTADSPSPQTETVFIGSPHIAETAAFKNKINGDYWVSGKYHLINYMQYFPE